MTPLPPALPELPEEELRAIRERLAMAIDSEPWTWEYTGLFAEADAVEALLRGDIPRLLAEISRLQALLGAPSGDAVSVPPAPGSTA